MPSHMCVYVHIAVICWAWRSVGFLSGSFDER
jgi:hypothetical protein